MERDVEIFYIRFSSTLAETGQHLEAEYLVRRREEVFRWDLARFVSALGDFTTHKDFLVHRWWKPRYKRLQFLFELIFLPESTFTGGKRSAGALARIRGDVQEFGEQCEDSATLSTDGLLTAFAFFMKNMHSDAAKAYSREVARLFCETVLLPDILDDEWFSVSAATANECEHHLPGNEVCAHLSSVIQAAQSEEKSPQLLIFDYFSTLLVASHACASCRVQASLVLTRIARLVEARVPSISHTSDPLKSMRPSNFLPSKRRRQEEGEYKKAITVDVVDKGLAETSSCYLKASGDHDGRVSDRWINKSLCEYQMAAWMNSSGCRRLTVAADAARIGNPAEDTLAIALDVEGGTQRFGVVAPPQVLTELLLLVI